MSGMIGVISDHAARYTWFSQSLAGLDKPEGTRIEWMVGANRGASRDALAQICMDDGREWIFFIDDDQAFPKDTLMRLLAHGHPVVSALIVQRGKPFLPTCYASFEKGKFKPLDLRSVGHGNLVACAGVGSGGLLVRSHVFEQLGDPPWFLYTEEFGEDLFFSRRLADAAIQMLVDTGTRVGHIIPAAVFATESEDDWAVGIQLADGTKTTIGMDHKPGR